MLTFREIRSAHLERPTVLTVGNFDGVHRGHRALLERVRDLAQEMDAESGLITFDPHPLTVVRPGHVQSLLTTPAERLRLAAQVGLTLGVIQPFTPEIAALGPAVFMGLLKTHFNLAALVVGPDFALGRNRAGDVHLLAALGEEIGYRLVILEPLDWQGKVVRSSAIRVLLDAGQVAEAADLLGRPYHVTGVVVHGDHRGRTIGVPTANLEIAADKHWPANGVYATRTTIHGRPGSLPGVTNLGVRPTVDGSVRRCETHLLDFPPPDEDGDLYGKTLTVEFLARLRGEQRFSGLPELVAQIQRDMAQARELLRAPVVAVPDEPRWDEATVSPFFLTIG
jgi:riboflavin kinase/FMN adenylyltransferase